jgi:hypothetical protein
MNKIDMALQSLIEDLTLNHEYCPKETILDAAAELRRLHSLNQELLEADLFWDANNPEDGFDCIYELISNYSAGDELKILRAKVLAPIKIKITQDGYEEFDWIEQTLKDKNDTL